MNASLSPEILPFEMYEGGKTRWLVAEGISIYIEDVVSGVKQELSMSLSGEVNGSVVHVTFIDHEGESLQSSLLISRLVTVCLLKVATSMYLSIDNIRIQASHEPTLLSSNRLAPPPALAHIPLLHCQAHSPHLRLPVHLHLPVQHHHRLAPARILHYHDPRQPPRPRAQPFHVRYSSRELQACPNPTLEGGG